MAAEEEVNKWIGNLEGNLNIEETPNQPGGNLRQRNIHPPDEIRPPIIARNQQTEILFWKVCCAILIIVIIIIAFFYISLDFEKTSSTIAVSSCNKQLRSCQKSLEDEKQNWKDKMEKELENEQKHSKEKLGWKESELKSCQENLEYKEQDCKEKMEKELEGCNKLHVYKQKYFKEKEEDINKQWSKELSFVNSELEDYKTRYNVTWYCVACFLVCVLCSFAILPLISNKK